MIKLESKNSLPSAVAVLEIKSSSEVASISLTVEEVRLPDAQGVFSVAKDKMKQILVFVGSDGTPCSIEGTVSEDAAIALDKAAFKVVVEIQMANELKSTYQAGRVSKAYTSLELVKVTEVWESEKKCLWRAKDAASQASSAATMGPDGKVTRAA